MGLLDKFLSEDDETVVKVMYQEYYHLMAISCMYPNMSTQSWRTYTYIVFPQYIIILSYHIAILFITAFKNSDDLFEMFQDFHLMILLLITLIVFIPFNYYRRTVSKVHRSIANGISNYDEETQSHREVLKEGIFKKKKWLVLLIMLTFTTHVLLFLVVGPTINNIGVEEEDNRIYNSAGVSLNVPFKEWVPYGTDTTLTLVIHLINEIFMSWTVSVIIAGVLVMAFTIAEYIILELNLLSYSLNRMQQRVEFLYEERYGKKRININSLKEDINVSKCFKECIKQNAMHHQKILVMCEQFNEINSLVLFLTHSTGAMIVGVSGALIIFGERVTEALYSINWFQADKDNAMSIQILQIGSQIPLAMKYSTLMDFKYETFTAVMNTSYSYFNLLFAFAQELT
ncbi:hypothetical protein O3M35_008890 [Rhynocoris fuscipes]|uniref:Odorant receptor n=1 Tax=Rhynocoris fuscipes TaxID=488301 RepID=A0AAW1D7T4_9HEMI